MTRNSSRLRKALIILSVAWVGDQLFSSLLHNRIQAALSLYKTPRLSEWLTSFNRRPFRGKTLRTMIETGWFRIVSFQLSRGGESPGSRISHRIGIVLLRS